MKISAIEKPCLRCHKFRVLTSVLAALVIIGILVRLFFVSSTDSVSLVKIDTGVSITEAAESLVDQGVLDDNSVLLIVQRFRELQVVAGTYDFSEPNTIWKLASRLNDGDFGIEFVKVTIPEGLTTEKMAALIEEQIPNFPKEEFIDLAVDHEGHLFPDTYNFSLIVSPEEVLEVMLENFDKRTEDLKPISDEELVMASIIEREVPLPEDRRMISDILWRRIDEGIPLQVDSTLDYLLGKSSEELTIDDLDFDSEFNTYKNLGLPPKPISNPGVDSIAASRDRTPNNFWYFLSDDDGNTHFSSSLDEHNDKKARFLD